MTHLVDACESCHAPCRPVSVEWDRESLKAAYVCGCGHRWFCWWHPAAVGGAA